MISNGHSIDRVHKQNYDIDKILNRNLSVFETPHTIYPDIRLEYIANGSSDQAGYLKPDVYYSLPQTASYKIQSFEVKFSVTNCETDQCILGNTSLPRYWSTPNDLKYYDFTGTGIFISNMKPNVAYLNNDPISDSSTWIRYCSGINTTGGNAQFLFPAGFPADNSVIPEHQAQSNTVFCAGYAVSTALVPGKHRFYIGDDNVTVYDSTRYSSNNQVNGIAGPGIMYTFRARTDGWSSCYSGTKIHFIKHYARISDYVNGIAGLQRELIAYWIPVLHWDNDSSTYRSCFYDKINNVYSSYNLGSDKEEYQITRDKMLDYIDNGPYLGVPKDVYFDTDTYIMSSSNDSSTAFEFGYSGVDASASLTGSVIFGCDYGNTEVSFHKLRYNLGPTGYINNTSNYLEFNRINDSSMHNVIYNFRPDYPYIIFDSSIDAWGQGTGNISSGEIDAAKNNPICIFRYNTSPNWGATRIHYFNTSKLEYRNSIACLIPVLHNGTPCLYDLRRERYIYNSGNYQGLKYKIIGY